MCPFSVRFHPKLDTPWHNPRTRLGARVLICRLTVSLHDAAGPVRVVLYAKRLPVTGRATGGRAREARIVIPHVKSQQIEGRSHSQQTISRISGKVPSDWVCSVRHEDLHVRWSSVLSKGLSIRGDKIHRSTFTYQKISVLLHLVKGLLIVRAIFTGQNVGVLLNLAMRLLLLAVP